VKKLMPLAHDVPLAQPGLFLAQWVAAHIADSDRLGKVAMLARVLSFYAQR
jgi:hypothetical protein